MPKANFRDFVTWTFYLILSFSATRLVNAVDDLKIEMAKIGTIVNQHEKRLDKLEK